MIVEPIKNSPLPALPSELLWDDRTIDAIELAERELEKAEVERLAARIASLKEES